MMSDGTRGWPRPSAGHRWDPPEGAGRAAGARRPLRAAPTVLGLVLLALWGFWWTSSVVRDKLASGRFLWFTPCCAVKVPLAGDLVICTIGGAKVWWAGGDPYPLGCVYPPHLYRLFAWSTWMKPWNAMAVWEGALTVMAVAGGWLAWRTRRVLGLYEVPLPLLLAALLFSTPVVFAMERGNCDLLILLTVVASVLLLRSRSYAAECLVGVLMANAMWLKYYPGLLMLGMLALGRRRVLPSFLLVGGAIGLYDYRGVMACMKSIKMIAAMGVPSTVNFYAETHSLSSNWAVMLARTRLQGLARIPGEVAAPGLLMPLVFWISYRIYRCPHRSRLAYPYLLWLLAAATFMPTLAVDYNLFYLPLAALTVWDRRDPVIVHMMMALLALWWQPFNLPIDGRMLFVFKLLGLAAVAISLVARTREVPHDDGAPSPEGSTGKAQWAATAT